MFKQSIGSLAIAFLVLSASAFPALALPVAILNPGFEVAALSCQPRIFLLHRDQSPILGRRSSIPTRLQRNRSLAPYLRALKPLRSAAVPASTL